MPDLWGVALGGAIGVAGTVATALIDRRGRRQALRAAFRAEIKAIIEITEARKHEDLAIEVAKRFRGGEDVTLTYFGIDDGAARNPIFDANVGRIGELGATFAAKVSEFYMGVLANRTTMRAFSEGQMDDHSTTKRAEQIEADLEIWRRTKLVGEWLVREL